MLPLRNTKSLRQVADTVAEVDKASVHDHQGSSWEECPGFLVGMLGSLLEEDNRPEGRKFGDRKEMVGEGGCMTGVVAEGHGEAT